MTHPSSTSSSERPSTRVDRALLLVLALVATGEVGLRLASPMGTAARPDTEEGYFPPPHLFDREVGYRYRPRFRSRFVRRDFENVMVTNAHGFHAPPFQRDRPPGTYRVALLGDSMLAANQVQAEQTWPFLLERRLTAVRGRRVEVLSFGVDGYRAWNMARLLTATVLGFRPDAVVLWGDEAVLRNPYELYRTVARDRILAGYDPDKLLAVARLESDQSSALGPFLIEHSLLSRQLVLWSGKRPISLPNYRMIEGASPQVHRLDELLREMHASCRREGVALGVFYRNHRPPPGRDACVALGIPVVTDAAILPTYEGLTFPHDPHFDVRGHGRYAEASSATFDELLRALSRDEPR